MLPCFFLVFWEAPGSLALPSGRDHRSRARRSRPREDGARRAVRRNLKDRTGVVAGSRGERPCGRWPRFCCPVRRRGGGIYSAAAFDQEEKIRALRFSRNTYKTRRSGARDRSVGGGRDRDHVLDLDRAGDRSALDRGFRPRIYGARACAVAIRIARTGARARRGTRRRTTCRCARGPASSRRRTTGGRGSRARDRRGRRACPSPRSASTRPR